MKTKTIPFAFATAKKIQAGEIEGKIKTRDGKDVRIICWDRKNEHHTPIVALIDNKQREELYFYSEAGEYDFGNLPLFDLILEVPDNEPQFKPFDRVLVRDRDDDYWVIAFFSHYDEITENEFPYCTNNGYSYAQCIHYEGNEHLVGATDKPKEE